MRSAAFHTSGRFLAAAIAVLSALQPLSLAAPPLTPLPPPIYSFDLQSPAVLGGLVGASDILVRTPAGVGTLVPGPALGLLSPADELDGLSRRNADWSPSARFSVLFSVTRQSMGVALPDANLVALGVPYNMRDQRMRGHAAGDQYLSLSTFALNDPARVDRGTSNNALVRNQFNEGGTDFGATPSTGASAVTPGADQDDVDAAIKPESTRVGPVFVYFSAATGSPSLPAISGGQPPSGATIFFNPEPLGFTPTTVFAGFQQLGLQQADDIDALIVFDFNSNGVYNPGDVVLFSLTPESPSLEGLPGGSPTAPAADLYIARPGQPTRAFINAFELGLGHPADDLDALDFIPCVAGSDCAALAGIRVDRADLDCDHQVTFADIDAFVLALSGPTAFAAKYPACIYQAADCNCDGEVNFQDIDAFVACLSGNCPCP